MRLEDFWMASKTEVYDTDGNRITAERMLKMADRIVAEFEPTNDFKIIVRLENE